MNQADPWIPKTVDEWTELHREIESFPEDKRFEWIKAYGEASLYYLARRILTTKNPDWIVNGKQALDHEFALWFANEVQENYKGTLFLVSREHLKSTIGTFAHDFFLVINDPNETIANISDTLKLSTKFVRRKKAEMQSKNPLLHILWPGVFWKKPQKESPTWSLQEQNPGLEVRRSINVSEATFTPVGLDSAVETGPHYNGRRYDDIVTRRNTRNPGLMEKTRENLKASHSIGREGGWASYLGTTYHPLDAYHDLEERGINVVREPCWTEKNGAKVSVYYSVEYLEEKKQVLGEEEFAIQWELNPRAGMTQQRIEPEWIRYYDPLEELPNGRFMWEHLARMGNTYMTVDGAGGEKENALDSTVIQIWSAQVDESIVLLDMVWDVLDPDERTEAAIELYLKWAKYRFQDCRWESYGMDSDIFWLEQKQTRTGNHFPVHAVAGTQKGAKKKRINGRVFPCFRERRVVLPEELLVPCKRSGGAAVDLMQVFVHQEVLRWPLVEHDDCLDCMSRLFEPKRPIVFPSAAMAESKKRDIYAEAAAKSRRRAASVWAPWVN